MLLYQAFRDNNFIGTQIAIIGFCRMTNHFGLRKFIYSNQRGVA